MYNPQQNYGNYGNNQPNNLNPLNNIQNNGYSRPNQQYGQSQYGQSQYGQSQYGQPQNYPNSNDVQGYNNNYHNNYNQGYNNSDQYHNNYEKNQLYGGGDIDGLYANSRQGFIRKVYTILSMQLIFTALVALWAMNSQTFKSIFINTPMIIVVSVSLMAISFVVACCQEVMRKYGLPILIVFTLLFSILVGIICAQTKSNVVLTAFGITAFLVIALTAYACFTKTDLTGLGPYLFIFCMVLFVFGIVLIFWRNPIVHLIYACLACLLYCVFLIFDTQLVLGRFQNAYSLDDAYIAAIQLYIDIIEIFLQLIRIIGFIDG